ncbi:MAG: phosphoribosylglycinamide formyltransferase [Bacteroidales bacterium]|nr:phosphoribosylglycinamide formyltransferase [Bacteroidales bacterium]
MYKLAIFASGSGSNAENIIQHFQYHPSIEVTCICTNRPDAYVIERARKYKVSVLVFTREEFYQSEKVLDFLRHNKINFIVLAGFLWLVPEYLINGFPNKILNIHPALLPKYGGKGMYGNRVHQAVIDHHENLSGITIHLVNSEYDRGDTLFQVTCQVDPSDTAETLASKVHQLEYEHFPRIIELEVMKRIGSE